MALPREAWVGLKLLYMPADVACSRTLFSFFFLLRSAAQHSYKVGRGRNVCSDKMGGESGGSQEEQVTIT